MADILHRIRIAAPAERVFRAITTSEGLRGWWTRDATAAAELGGVAVLRFDDGKVVFRMRVEELEAPRRVAWKCIGDWDEWTGTRLTWDLKPDPDGGTVLHFAHRDWATTEGEYPVCNATWGHLLHLLRDHAEGKPVEPPFPG